MITTTHELADALYALGIDAAGQRHTIENYATPQEAVADMDTGWLAEVMLLILPPGAEVETSHYTPAQWLDVIYWAARVS